MTSDPAALAARGFKVFPIAAGKKAPPLWKNWPERASTTINPAEWPDGCNVGIHCEGLVVVDVDPKNGGDESYAKLDITEGFPNTLWAATPSGGRHLYYSLPEGHRGVANSVQSLGAGIDVRSSGGYVLAPGSRTTQGSYSWGDEAPIAPVPDWVLSRLDEAAPRTTASHAPVADAPDTAYSRAADWLRTAERSVKGQGGDQAAYRVACALRDRGLSEAQTRELMRSEAWDYGCGWRDGWLEEKPIRSAYRYAQNEPGVRALKKSDLPEAVALPGTAPLQTVGTSAQVPTIRPQRLAEFAGQDAKGRGYVVKGLLQRASYAEVYGPPGAGKTFVALDVAYHVAAGRPWRDRLVHAGPVLYLAYEGLGGLVKRAKALRQKYGEADVPLYVLGSAFNLRESAGRAELGAVIAALPEKPVLVVIDTFARALMGGDENSAQDVGAFNGAVAALIEATGACVQIIHHSGKDKSKGARGSSALLGALDTEIEVDEGLITTRKQRDVEITVPLGFKLVPVVVGIDEDGDEMTSCTVAPAVADSQPGRKQPLGNALRGWNALIALSPQNAPIPVSVWKAACSEFLDGKSRAQRFYDLRTALIRDDFIEVDEADNVRRKMR